MKICYQDKNFREGSLALISVANAIIEEYEAQGYVLTLRQLYYQFVARDYIANNQREYKRLGSVVNDGRMAGLISWAAIEDRTRAVQTISTWGSPAEIIETCVDSYREDRWENQPYYVELWVEKEALAGVFDSLCDELQIPILSCRGYVSQSEMWRSSNRMRKAERDGKQVVILHFGDHDPSGLDMTRDNTDRPELFGADLEIRRLALNMDQIEEYNPPPNPAKLTDSRAKEYVEEYGNKSWELDALEPSVLNDLARDEIEGLIDGDAWVGSEEHEDEGKAQLRTIADQLEK